MLWVSYHYKPLLVYKYYWFTCHVPVIWWANIIFQRYSTVSLFLEPRVNFLWCCHVMYHTVLYEYTQPLTHRKYPISITLHYITLHYITLHYITLHWWRSAVFAASIHTWHKTRKWLTHLVTHTKGMLKKNHHFNGKFAHRCCEWCLGLGVQRCDGHIWAFTPSGELSTEMQCAGQTLLSKT
jgi:hypothetical protein